MQDVNNGRNCGGGGYIGTLVQSAQFFSRSKIVLKYIVYDFKKEKKGQ